MRICYSDSERKRPGSVKVRGSFGEAIGVRELHRHRVCCDARSVKIGEVRSPARCAAIARVRCKLGASRRATSNSARAARHVEKPAGSGNLGDQREALKVT
jgi:hypothetical protein